MDVLLVTPELVHYTGSSSLAESAGALAKALKGLGHKVQIASPLWATIDPSAHSLARRLVRLEVDSRGEKKKFALYEGKTTAGVDVSFLEEASLFPAGATTNDAGPDAARRWGAFTRALATLIERRAEKGEGLPHVIHLFGFQLGALPAYLAKRPTLASIPTVFTVHELTQRGVFERSELEELGLSPEHFGIDGAEFFGKVSTLKAGLQYATRVVAPSPSLAERFAVEAGGAGLEGVVRARGDAFVGVMDGVDASIWNPATDPHLDVHFDPIEMATRGLAKQRNKAAVQRALGLEVRGDVPLTVSVLAGRPDERAFLAALPRILRNDVQLVVLSEGSEHEDVADLARRYPERLHSVADAPAPLLHRVLGAAELFLQPALDDAFGSLALKAQRYGALPIARALGLVADAVVDADAHLASGTGFTFDEASADALFGATMRAVTAYRDAAAFRAMAARAMDSDHSWDRSARRIERIYRAIAKAPSQAEASA